MQLPNQLKEKINQPALIIISSEQQAKFYMVVDDVVTLAREVGVEKPEYSDHEGFFQGSGGGKELNSGSVEKDVKHIVREDFLKVFTPGAKEMLDAEEFKQVYLLAPSTVLSSLEEHLPKARLSKPLIKVAGNYVKLSPLEVLEKHLG